MVGYRRYTDDCENRVHWQETLLHQRQDKIAFACQRTSYGDRESGSSTGSTLFQRRRIASGRQFALLLLLALADRLAHGEAGTSNDR